VVVAAARGGDEGGAEYRVLGVRVHAWASGGGGDREGSRQGDRARAAGRAAEIAIALGVGKVRPRAQRRKEGLAPRGIRTRARIEPRVPARTDPAPFANKASTLSRFPPAHAAARASTSLIASVARCFADREATSGNEGKAGVVFSRVTKDTILGGSKNGPLRKKCETRFVGTEWNNLNTRM
jgi:hypothetical protein